MEVGWFGAGGGEARVGSGQICEWDQIQLGPAGQGGVGSGGVSDRVRSSSQVGLGGVRLDWFGLWRVNPNRACGAWWGLVGLGGVRWRLVGFGEVSSFGEVLSVAEV